MALDLANKTSINGGQQFQQNQILTSTHMNEVQTGIKKSADAEAVAAAFEDFDESLKLSGTVTAAIGGFAAGKVISNMSVTDILDTLLFPYVAPKSLSIALSSAAGTYEYGTRVVVSSVTPTFTAGSKAINSVKIGTSSGGSDLFNGSSATNKIAIGLTNNKTFDGTNGGTIYCSLSDGETTLNASARVDYTYYYYAKLNTSTTPNTSGLSKKNATDGDDTYSYSSGQYLWLYSRSSGKKIQTYVAGSWADVNTASAGQVTITLNSGTTATYYAYRTDRFTANGSARYRLK